MEFSTAGIPVKCYIGPAQFVLEGRNPVCSFMAMIDRRGDDLLLSEYARQYTHHIPVSHRSFYSEDDLTLFIRARYQFFKKRERDVQVLVSDPPENFFWLVNATIVETMMPDSPFIVDTILEYFASREIRINLLTHPIFSVERDAMGNATALGDPTKGAHLESQVYMEIPRGSKESSATIRRELSANLGDLRVIVQDFPEMMRAFDSAEENIEAAGSTVWLRENFVFLGMSRLKEGRDVSHYGLMRQKRFCEALRRTHRNPPDDAGSFGFVETDAVSEVNRRRNLFTIAIGGENGVLIAGHFARRAESALREDTPALIRLEKIAAQFRQPKTSYLRKQLLKAAQIVPIGVLFTRSLEFLTSVFNRILYNVYADDVDYEIVVDELYGLVWIVSLIPVRDSGQIPGRRYAILKESLEMDEVYNVRGPLYRNEVWMIALRSRTLAPAALAEELKQEADEMFQSWTSRFRRLVSHRIVGEKMIQEKLQKFFLGMSPEYEIQESPEEALFDLMTLEGLAQGAVTSRFYPAGSPGDRVKIYSSYAVKLSELVPVLVNFGFEVRFENTFPYQSNGTKVFAYSITVAPVEGIDANGRVRIAESIAAALSGRCPSEPLDALVVTAGLTLRELLLVKAWSGYLLQVDKSAGRQTVHKTLCSYPSVIRAFVDAFAAKFDPEKSGHKSGDIEVTLQVVRSAAEDSIFRGVMAVLNATVRTNFFLNKNEIAFKLRSSEIPGLPKPVPLFEIFVYGADMEGIHLRGGMVARGGIRWSDRVDDFRTEVLGLMKAQMVKNTIIVPVGSKGGFVLKGHFKDRPAMQAAGIDAYKRFIGALLDLTDNRKGHAVVPAPGIIRLDGDDSYLVVAADKGTASFSDIANEIAVSRGFWLSDAFASGGANGYDHKKQGITARGAWESVKLHFRELGIDPEKDVIRVAGVGDMSGDVFGNGLLLSRSVKLVAAFNHQYIFLDPDADPAQSFQERKRLFQKALNWNQYNEALISKGGGVFDRTSRKIALSAEVKSALGIKAASLNGDELVQAILRAPVDLLWNGGIGTYVKASTETNFQAGDSANDRCRINASELRARVVAEGGNLGFTQAGRVEAAKSGVRMNSDAIDNSGGVDMSDHEVNLKILLDLNAKTHEPAERTRLIRRVEAQEIKLVLTHNASNNLALSLDERRVPGQFGYFRALIKFLNRQGLINREADAIPFEADLDKLEQEDRRLARPVLAALMGFTKLYVTDTILADSGFNEPRYDDVVVRYFPDEVAATASAFLQKHPLRREIIITEIVNEIVNQAGIAFFQRMVVRTGQSLTKIAETAHAFFAFAGLGDIRRSLPVTAPSELRYRFLIELEDRACGLMEGLLESGAVLSGEEKGSMEFSALMKEACKVSDGRLPRDVRAHTRGMTDKDTLAVTNAFHFVEVMHDAFQIHQARRKGGQPAWTAEDYFRIVDKYHIKDIRNITAGITQSTNWDIRFASRLERIIDSVVLRLVSIPEGAGHARARVILGEIKEMGMRGGLSAATLFEMLSAAAAVK